MDTNINKSLFPAYKQSNDNNNESETQPNWLTLNSYENQKSLSSDQRFKEINVKSNELFDKNKTIKSQKSDFVKKRDPEKSERNETKYNHLINKTFIEETGLSPQNAFRIDKTCDKNNLAFDSLYFKSVSKFDKNKIINTTKRKLTDNFVKSKKHRKLRYYSNENRPKNEPILDFSTPELPQNKGSVNFIPINKKSINEIISQSSNESNPLGLYDLKTSLYAEGKGGFDDKPLPESKIKFHSMNANKDGKEIVGPKLAPTRDQHIYETTQEFNSYLRENEGDVQKWLKFIEFQETTIETDGDKVEGKSSEIGISEKKLSICEKALKSNPKSIELLLCRLEILDNIWENEKLEKEWKKLTFLYPNSILLWKKYLKFSQRNITNFSAGKTIKIYQKCISILSQMLEKTFQSHSAPEDLENQIVTILSSYCSFLSTIGHTERAVSTFQALIEFNLFIPEMLTFEMTVKDWLTFFEPFWDSGSARFGEDEAVGWGQVMHNKNTVKQTNNSAINSVIDDQESQILSEKVEKNEIWIKFELLRQSFHWLPLKTDSEDIEDPERVVLSDDVIEMLVRLRSIDSKYRLIKEFLKFFDVNCDRDLESDESIDKTICLSDFAIELPLLPKYHNQQKFISNIFESSVKLFSGKTKLDLILIWINYETINNAFSVKNMRKFFKNFLRNEEYRNSLEIWSKYATFEYCIENNVSEGRKVFQTAISLMINNSNDLKLFKFVRDYVELELGIIPLEQMSKDLTKRINLDKTGDQLSLNYLLSVCCRQLVTNSSPTLVLKAINIFKQQSIATIDQFFGLVFIHYLSHGISPAFQLIEEQLTCVKTSIDEKSIFNIYLQLLLLQIRRNSGVSLKPIRSVLSRALHSFPTEHQFLSLLVNIELKSNVLCRTRSFFNKTFNSFSYRSDEQNWTLIIHSINSELKRMNINNDLYTGYDTKSGVINRVRSLFERSVNSKQFINSVTLWRLYCKFEIDLKNSQKAKSLFYRSLQNCSYSKLLYLDGIQYFSKQLQELIDIMTEKEIRVRTPIEEIDLLISSL